MLLVGVLVASVLGSVHCAAMCGAFTCLYALPGSGASRPASRPASRAASRAASHAAYNAGRLVSYVALGAVAGALGARVERAGAGAGVAHLANMVAGILMVAWAAGMLAATAGVRVPVTLAPDWAKRALGRAIVGTRERSAATRALVVGLVTTLLPCGWLYTFVVVAGGSGHALSGALVMTAFWAGTVPALLAVGAGAAALLGPAARRLPVVSAAIVLTLGVLAIAGKLRAPDVASHAGMAHMTMPRVGR